jgi:hypothetical protein
MDEQRLKKRIYAFQFAGILNLFLGCYVLLYGGGVDPGTRNIMLAFFFGFAALDFWFPTHLKKKFAEQQALMAQAQGQTSAIRPPEAPKS